MSIIFPAECHLVALEGDQAMIGDGDPVGVGSKIAQDMPWAAKGWLEVNHPILPEQRAQEGSKGLLLLKRLQSAGEH